MVFDKQHLSLFVALAFLIVYANAVPTASFGNEKTVERLRGDLHQFIEMIIGCLTNSKVNHSNVEPSQIHKFKQITKSLQDDVGLEAPTSPENEEQNEAARKFIQGDNNPQTTNEDEETSSEVPTNAESNNNSKETTEDDDVDKDDATTSSNLSSYEKSNKRKFNLLEGDSHSYTPRPTSSEEATDPESTEKMSTTNPSMSTYQPLDSNDIGLRIQSSRDSTIEDATSENDDESSQSEEAAPETKATSFENISSSEDEKSASPSSDASAEEKLGSQLGKIRKNMPQKPRQMANSEDESSSSNSSESKDKSDKSDNSINTEEIQVRNLIKDAAPKFVSSNSVRPYEALHIYGVQNKGPINKIVFEGGEHHPPRPLTIRESNHLKEFIRMVINTNKMHNPMAAFPSEDDVSSRSGFSEKHITQSPWADKPVPLELV